MTKIQDLRQLAHTIKTETKVGGNTADRVGSAFEGVADALDGTEQIAEMDKAVQEVQQQVEASKAQIQSLVNALPVVQQTGNSTTSVMSQKAVTDALAVSGGSVTEFVQIADQTNMTKGKYYDKNGVLQDTTQPFYYIEIPLDGYEEIFLICQTYGPLYNCLFDAGKSLIKASYDYNYKLSDYPTAKYLGVSSAAYTLIAWANKKVDATTSGLISVAGLNKFYDEQKITYRHVEGGFYGSNNKFAVNSAMSCNMALVRTYDGMNIKFSSYASGSAFNYAKYDASFKLLGMEVAKDYSAGTSITVEKGVAYIDFQSLRGLTVTLGGNTETGSSNGVLFGKSYVAIGDSFTNTSFDDKIESGKYAGYEKLYQYFIGNRNMMNVMTQGQSGSVLNWYLAGKKYEQIPTDVDYITIWYGINDKGHGISIGTVNDEPTSISSEKDTTTCGGFNFFFKWLLTNRPYAHIGVVITDFCEALRREAIMACCQKWGVAYLDLYDPTVPMIRTRGETKYTHDTSIAPDGYVSVCEEAKTLRSTAFSATPPSNIHPSQKCHEWQSYIIENFMRGL